MADVSLKTKREPGTTPVGTAVRWLEKIDSRLDAEKEWRGKGEKVVKRFRDEQERGTASSRVNILWSNTEVQKAALYVRTAKPDIRARFPDAKAGNTATRLAAEAMERGVIYSNDVEDVDDPLSAAIDDMLLPGRGTVWVSYEPEIEEPEEDDERDDEVAGSEPASGVGGSYGADEAAGAGAGTGSNGADAGTATGRISNQYLCLEYVFWKDFTHGLARTWKRVPWVARRLYWTEDEVETKWPKAAEAKLDASYKLQADDASSDMEDGFVEVWEIWARAGKKRIYVARGYPDILQEDEDPYKLSLFFPCPKPLYGVKTTDRMIPQPEFLQYQDQANELDIISTRIRRLTQELRWRGIYDATIPDGGSGQNVFQLLKAADDGEFVPHEQYQALMGKGGIEAAFALMPIERIIEVLTQLYTQRGQLIQAIYEITGISDIVRGSTDPNETKGAQVLKAQFGSMRIQKRQREVQRFIRDAYRLEAEIVAEHFTQETLAGITGLDLPTKQEQLQLQQKLAVLQQPPGMGHNGGPPMLAGAPPQNGGMPPSGPSAMPPPGMMPAGPGAMPPPGAPDAASMPQGPGGPADMMPPGAPPPGPGATPAAMAPPGIDIPPELVSRANGPTWDDVMVILRSDKVRQYRVDVETDDTEMQDAQQEKQNRVEFSVAFEKLVQAAYQASITAPQMLPLIKEWMLFSIRTFKVGRGFEQVVEDMFDKLAKEPPPTPADQQGPQSDPILLAKAKAEAMSLTAKAANDTAMLQIEQGKAQSDAAYKVKTVEVDAAHKQAMVEADKQHKAAQIDLERQRVGIEAAKLDHAKTVSAADIGLKRAAHNNAMVDETNKQLADETSAPTGNGAGDGAPQGGVLQTLMQGLSDVIRTVTDGQKQIADAMAQEQAQTAQLIGLIAAPKRVIRGPDGKAAGVETVTH